MSLSDREIIRDILATATKDEAIRAAHARAQAAAHKAWESRRAGRTKQRPARARIVVVDGPFAGKRILLDRATVESGTWEVPGATYRFAGAWGERIAYVAHESDSLPLLAWRAWNISVTRVEDERTSGAIRRAQLAGLTKAEAERAIARELIVELATRGSWPSTGPIAAACDVTRPSAASLAADPKIVFGRDPSAPAVEYVPAHPSENPPVMDCSCGIYCCSTWYALHAIGYTGMNAIGLIAGWGKVIEHETGYRFGRAYPLLIVVNANAATPPITAADLVRGLRRTYRVPVAAAHELAIHDKVEELVARPDSPLPAWAYDALPPDLRAAGHRHKMAKERQHGEGI